MKDWKKEEFERGAIIRISIRWSRWKECDNTGYISIQ